MMRAKWLQQEAWQQHLFGLAGEAKRLWYQAFIAQKRGVDIAAGLLSLAAAAYLIITLLYLPPSQAEPEHLNVPQLTEPLIDEAVQAIDTRARAHEVGFVSPYVFAP